ncbi:HMG domain-containing protein 4 [Bulinus truncatus]|nr:HMG domain-containing protein 4 [Bulinus truncatus]
MWIDFLKLFQVFLLVAMSKRESLSDYEGSASKMSRGEEQDEAGQSGRSGRVRKKSAKVLEMEEFEQVEKTQQVTKKTKTPKVMSVDNLDGGSEKLKSVKKTTKLIKASGVEVTPVTSKKVKSTTQLAKALQLTPMAMDNVTKSETNYTELLKTIKTEVEADHQLPSVSSPDQKSVIKYLLSSPTSANKMSSAANLTSQLSPTETPPKKTSKKPKEEKVALKMKVKKEKPEPALLGEEPLQGLKMKIFASSDPNSAQVTLSTVPKPKKSLKKSKPQEQTTSDRSQAQSLDLSPSQSSAKKSAKKLSKKKEKLIQEAISAAKQMPNLAALVTSPNFSSTVQGQPVVSSAKPAKKKSKPLMMSLNSPTDEMDNSDLIDEDGDDDDDDDEDDDEMNLVISETESKKKKIHSKKKGSALKEKSDSLTPKGDKLDDKLSKRAPTAYMLFCNTHRPTIVNENPGIEFAAISRKLGEMWQTLSNKQKLQWRRKAQRRRKKSNLISTGKAGKESVSLTSSVPVSSTPVNKLSAFIHKAQRLSPEEVPLSPTKTGDQNLSIEPIDVAAHLKLLGESLSIIGMRLQEHKGMIAVQGSLSVLLDSLICACGPLLCLTQQVPGMDGCSPAVHSQTLDSVAYVMPGL